VCVCRFDNLLLPRKRGFPFGYVCKPLVLRKDTRVSSMNTNKKKKRKKKTALVICRDRKRFWTTQTQFWQWVREGVVTKTGEQPLTGLFRREHEELMVLLSNTVLNLAHPNHMREALLSRRVGMAGK
jgi:hypothetical protein